MIGEDEDVCNFIKWYVQNKNYDIVHYNYINNGVYIIALYRGLVNHFSRSELARYLAIILYHYEEAHIKPHYSIDIINNEVMEKLECIKAFKEVIDDN